MTGPISAEGRKLLRAPLQAVVDHLCIISIKIDFDPFQSDSIREHP